MSIYDIIQDKELLKFIDVAIETGYSSNHVPQNIIDELLESLESVRIGEKERFEDILTSDGFLVARKRYKEEMRKPLAIYNYVREYIRKGATVLDVGCGKGDIGRIILDNDEIATYIGTKITHYENANSDEGNFKIVCQSSETDIPIDNDSLDAILMIDAIHHTRYGKQAELLGRMGEKLKADGKLIIFEFTFSQDGYPALDNVVTNKFSELSLLQKFNYMSFIDGWGNTIVSKSSMSVPEAYRTSEEWQSLFSDLGGKLQHCQYIGFVEGLFHQGPYCLFVMTK